MSTRVANQGSFERDTSGNKTSNFTKAQGDQGTVRVSYQKREYVFGPGEVKTIWDDGIAAALIAADGRLVAADSRHGMPKSNASLSNSRW